jgi:hypothetical protein
LRIAFEDPAEGRRGDGNPEYTDTTLGSVAASGVTEQRSGVAGAACRVDDASNCERHGVRRGAVRCTVGRTLRW